MKRITKLSCLFLMLGIFTMGAIGSAQAEKKVAIAATNAVSNFESVPLGPTGAIPLNAPPGVTAVLSGTLEVEASAANWPPFFQTKAVKTTGPATLFLAGPVTGIGFAATNRSPNDPNPTMSCTVITGGAFAQTATLTFLLNGQTTPVFGNFGIVLQSGVYGFCTFNADLIDNIVIQN